MRRMVRACSLVILLLLVCWLGISGLIWSRNSVPALNLPVTTPSPVGNIYNEYLAVVNSISNGDKSKLRDYNALGHLTPPEEADIIDRNSKALTAFHKLPGKPCQVIQIETQMNFVPAQDFAFLTGLITLEAQRTVKTDPGKALDQLLDGLVFTQDIQRGGAFVHQGATTFAVHPLSRGFPMVLSTLSIQDCDRGISRIEKQMKDSYPLSQVFEKERYVQLNKHIRTMQPQSMTGFHFQIPIDSYQREYLLKPKSAALVALDSYLRRWIEQVDKPIYEIIPPKSPEGEAGIFIDETTDEGNCMGYVSRYNYFIARVRLVYVALKLQSFYKHHGKYPGSLSDISQNPGNLDPFSGKAFIYHPHGSLFDLYSVGANGTDDGNEPEPSGRSGKDNGDISFKPKFVNEIEYNRLKK